MLKKLSLFIVAGLLVTAFLGCSPQAPSLSSGDEPGNGEVSAIKVILVVTRDFGKEVLLERTVEVAPDTSAMAALQKITNVETKYGGGFVSAINGIGSEYEEDSANKRDWFFYINGIQSNVGAQGYLLQNNDIEHWDFRDWSHQMFVPAIIGDFPQPFRSGYMGKNKSTIVVYDKQFEEDAELLVRRLRELGIKKVSAVRCSELTQAERQESHLILLGGANNGLIAELNNAYQKLGFYAYFRQGKLVVLNTRGRLAQEYGAGTGLIQATQNPWSPEGIGSGESAVWMVSGTDEIGVKSAVEILAKDSERLKYACSVVITEGRVLKVP